MKDTSWDHALEITAGGHGVTGHCGALLLRKAADRSGLTAGLDAALTRRGKFPQISRGEILASAASVIARGATAMADIEMLDQLGPLLGDAPSAPTLRRALEEAGDPAAGAR